MKTCVYFALLVLSLLPAGDVVAQTQYVGTEAAKLIEFATPVVTAGLELDTTDVETWSIRGELKNGVGGVVLKPKGEFWDISSHSFFQISFKNSGSDLVWIRGRLDNRGAEDWANSTGSSAFVVPGETATLGFPFPRPWEQNDAPEIFSEMSAKPNGHRTHWKRFDPKRVVACRLQLRSKSSNVSLENLKVSLEHPYGMDANQNQAKLPFLDAFGQARNLEWENKVVELDQLRARHAEESALLGADSGPAAFDRFGGWADGPKLEATGFFRVVKHNDRWWFVDPDGNLFLSHGMNTIGFRASTPIGGRKDLFEWLPEYGSPIFDAMIRQQDYRNAASFIRGNVYRTFEENWLENGHARIRKRLKNWGINTIGAWSDTELVDQAKPDEKIPYTEMLHLWRREKTRLAEDTPDPFAGDFEKRVSAGLQKIVDRRGNDPWCVGVFIDNEIDWHGDLVARVFAAPETQPAKLAFVDLLKNKYSDIGHLNRAWQTGFESWADLIKPQSLKSNSNRREDFDWLYGHLASHYYRICHEQMRKWMPNHLYLGSRIHKCPDVVAIAAAKYCDVYSINSYVDLAGKGNLPSGMDKPVLIAEFHFAASERGLGVGLSPVGDRLQRSRAFGAFVVSGLRQRNVVGTHWFAYADQSAAGRPYENYQIGFVDVTDTPYPMISQVSRTIADRMYEIRASKPRDLMATLSDLWITR